MEQPRPLRGCGGGSRPRSPQARVTAARPRPPWAPVAAARAAVGCGSDDTAAAAAAGGWRARACVEAEAPAAAATAATAELRRQVHLGVGLGLRHAGGHYVEKSGCVSVAANPTGEKINPVGDGRGAVAVVADTAEGGSEAIEARSGAV